MTQPKGFEEPGSEGKVCHLLKSLYGLKQAPRIWYERIWTYLVAAGFETSRASPCVFKMKEKQVHLLVYVDDILIIGKNDKEITEAKTIISKLYEVKDMGIARYFLGVGVHRDQDGGIRLSQQSYITRMCDKFYLTDAKPVTSPIDAGQMCKLRSNEPATAEESINVTKLPYRELIGGLMFVATRTRPDMASAVGILARRVADPREIDWQAAKRVLRYLKGTASLALTFPSSGDVNLTTYADADYATSSDRKSVSGVVILLGGNAVIDWISQ
jgi:Reverse transcriptase (RNA-dependent DNA polymerase)